MKKYLFLVAMLTFCINSFSQPAANKAAAVKSDYLKKSKTQKTVATILLAGGSVSVLTGYLIPKGELTSSCSNCLIYDTYYKNDNLRGSLVGFGILTMLISIPIYLASHHSKKKAMRLSFKNETAPQLQNNNFINRPVSSLSLRISL